MQPYFCATCEMALARARVERTDQERGLIAVMRRSATREPVAGVVFESMWIASIDAPARRPGVDLP
jgi:hypothetical protein